MSSIRKISSVWVILFASQSGICFGDSFFDFGLQWTQWMPTKGEVQSFASDGSAPVISVPVPKQAWRTYAADSNTDNTPVTNPPVINDDSHRPVKNNTTPKPVRTSDDSSNTVSSTPTYTPPVTPTTPTTPPVPVYQPPVAEPVSTPVATQPVAPPVTYNYASNPAPVSTPAPVTTSAPAVSPVPSSGGRFDALIRMDSGPFPAADQIVSGQPQAWYQSPVVASVYGGTPSADQQRTFEQDVLQKVTQTYADSGVNLNLTLDPNASVAHTISVISSASFDGNADAAGITAMNGDGFSFIDKLQGASSVNDLEWAVAHNVAHELLHAFDVPHHDTTGQYLDGAVANWDLMLDPNTKFSAAAVTDLENKLSGNTNGYDSTPDAYGFFGQQLNGTGTMAQLIDVQPVPEPATIVTWLVAAGCAYVVRRQRKS